MTMPRGVLLEADPRRDAAYRALALRAYRKMVRWIENAGEKDFEVRLTNHGGTRVLWDRMVGWGVKGPMYVQFEPENASAAGTLGGIGTVKHSDYSVLVLYVMKRPLDWNSLKQRMTKSHRWRSVFIHEFIHWLDEQRGLQVASTKVLNTQGYDAYVKTPEEFNAHYQEGAYNLERAIKGLLQSPIRRTRRGNEQVLDALQRKLPRDVRGFVRYAEGTGSPWSDVIKDAMRRKPREPTDKWHRKWRKRLVGLHRYLLDRYGDRIYPES